jgi:hypothetical protein
MTAEKGVLIVLLANWLGLSVDAVRIALTMPETGDGFHRGADRAMAVMGRGLIATMIALAAWVLGRRQPAGSWLRRVSLVPVAVTALLGLATMIRVLIAVASG